MDYSKLPGSELIQAGLADLSCGKQTAAALLVMIGGPRLTRLGISLPPDTGSDPEKRLYALLAEADPGGAHSRYNALIRVLVSFERAAECVV